MAEQTLAAQSSSAAAEGPPRVQATVLSAFVQRALAAAGLPAPDAAQVAELMVEADLRGSDTHGVIRLPLYVRRLEAGGINKQPNIRLIQDKPSAALVDGDNGMGHLVMRFAAHTAIAKAKRTGIGWVGARMSNHAGPAALYAMMPLSHDMIGIYLAVGSNNHLPPWGARENLLGTNPIAITIPALEEPAVVLHMAPTVAAFGKVRLKAQRGEEMPVGWMIDRDGKPLTDAKRADEGFLLPIGAFAPVEDFKRQVDVAVRTMRGAQRLPGIERIWLPGEQSHRKRLERAKSGVPMPKALRASLDTTARDLGIEPLA
jgi:LDH2 family malate/lactate/ureidoglycolate dehydrogenase